MEAKFAALKALLADHPDQKVNLLLNSITEELSQSLRGAIKDGEVIKEQKFIAQETSSEITQLRSYIQSAGHEPVSLSSEVERLKFEIQLMDKGEREGDRIDHLIYLIFHTITIRGWHKFFLDVYKSEYVKATRSQWAIVYLPEAGTGESLGVTLGLFPFLGSQEGRARFSAKLKSHGLGISEYGGVRMGTLNSGAWQVVGHFVIDF